MAASLKETKEIIKVLLQFHPPGMELKRLNQLYRKSEEMGIPYEKFGFCSLEEMMYDISDTVIIEGAGDTAEIFLPRYEDYLLDESGTEPEDINDGAISYEHPGRYQFNNARGNTAGM